MATGETKGQAKSGTAKTASKTDRKTKGRGSTPTKKNFKLTPPDAQSDEQLDRDRLKNAELILDRLERGEEPIYTCDIETDPFARGVVPVPFIIGLYDGLTFWSFKTDKHSTCVEKLRAALEDGLIEPGIIYMHNGGRFDFFYLLDFFEGRTTIINSRIVSALMPMGTGKHRFEKGQRFEWRDSFAIMPFPLKAYKKDKLEITWLSRELRDAHMGEIISYLKGDCVYLWDLCMAFQGEFGDHKTIASASFTELGKFHKYEALPHRTDKELREAYYFGGRVQCFKKGIIENPVAIYDVNSMYPYVMKDYYHPTGWPMTVDQKVHGWKDDATFSREKLKTFFLTVEGRNDGAFPTRMEDGSVDFTVEAGVFHVTIHEWLTALQLGRFKPARILSAHSFIDYSTFHLFVDHFYRLREKAKAEDDKMHSLFYKYILNSAYGKFGINPANYFNWKITKRVEDRPKGEGWTLEDIAHARYFVWKQPSQLFWNVKNIATAASITGAARSVLLRAIARSSGVLYCDTDSILCESFGNDTALRIDDKVLGAWKPEGIGSLAAIAGKKMYAVFDSSGLCVKHACKGVALTPEQIKAVANGEEIITWREAPTFQRDGSAKFISRTSRLT
jgi:DNA polymerase type B, organellar and viral